MTANDLLARPLEDLPRIVRDTDQAELWKLRTALAALAVDAARRAEYIDSMLHNQGHEKANIDQNKVARRVRRTVGYLIPNVPVHLEKAEPRSPERSFMGWPNLARS